MTIRFLIDECLSPELVQRAAQAGYPEFSCVRDRGLSGTKDWKLIEHARQPIHAGLVCLGSVHTLDLLRQHALFQVALNQVAELEDLVNTALEVFENEDGSIDLWIYDIPDPT